MSINLFLPFVSTAIMIVFVVSVLKRYFATKQLHFLFWGIGLAMFGAGSFAEAYLALAWNKWVFFSWYLFGAALNAAWLGHGTLYLMVRKNWRHAVSIVLIAGSLWASVLMVQAIAVLDEEVFSTSVAISEQYGTKALDEGEIAPEGSLTTTITNRDGEEVEAVRGLLPYGTPVRLTTPFLNIYGLLSLVGGAIYSAYLFWRKRVLPNRVIGNVLIAAGALLIGFASTLTRLGYGQFLYLAELLSAIIMFVGFRVTARPQAKEDIPASTATPAAAD
jgi:hypothetical protein